MMTPARLREEEDFKRRMKSGAEAQAAATAFRKQEWKDYCARMSAKHPGVHIDHGWTPVYRIARGFRPGHGKFS